MRSTNEPWNGEEGRLISVRRSSPHPTSPLLVDLQQGSPHVGDNVAISHHAEQSPSCETAKLHFGLFLASLITLHCICDSENHHRTFVISNFGGGQPLFFFFGSSLSALHCTFSSLFPHTSEKNIATSVTRSRFLPREEEKKPRRHVVTSPGPRDVLLDFIKFITADVEE